MEAIIAIAVILFVVWAKNNAISGDPTLTASGNLTVTASQAPVVDPYQTNQGGPIGSTFLSQTEFLQDPFGNLIEVPFRPSAPQNGGGIVANYDGVIADQHTNSVGSGVGSIEKINAPAAVATAPAGGVARQIVLPTYGGRSTLWGRIMAPAQLYQGSSSPAPANPAPQRSIATATPGRTSIITAGTAGPRATSSSSTPMPTASGVDLHAAPPVAAPAVTPQQGAVIRQITARRVNPVGF